MAFTYHSLDRRVTCDGRDTIWTDCSRSKVARSVTRRVPRFEIPQMPFIYRDVVFRYLGHFQVFCPLTDRQFISKINFLP